MSLMRFSAPLLAVLVLAATPALAQQRFVTVGTGGVTGVYYPAGGAICRLVNKGRRDHGIRCAVESTQGSVYNTRQIREGDLDFGIVQSDVQADAWNGARQFENQGAYQNLRAVFSVHAEPLQVMVRADVGIATVADFRGKRVNIGNPGSGTRVLAEVLFGAAGLTTWDLDKAGEVRSIDQAEALCAGEIDAAIWAAGMPNGSTMEATSACDVKILALADDSAETVLTQNTAYAAAVVPGGMYPGNPEDIPTWGPRATVVTDAQSDETMVYEVVRAVFEHIEEFRKLHPAFARVVEAEMIRDGLTAPLHPGAVRYYRERGWM